ncbi:hypothetical protein KC921_03405 [Candidatus Woesebacteria bacterium]|nr:hypothetical protein [Candidatus Woesebacteria bacterium]
MNKDKKIYYLGGVNAVGKSAFERELALAHPDRFQVVHGAGKLMEYLGLQPGDYAGLRGIARGRKAEAFSDLVFDLANNRDERSTILSTHFAIMNQGNIEWNTKEPWLSNVDALVLFRASMEVLFSRIAADDRDRNLFTPGLSENEQKAQLRMFAWREVQRARSLARQHNLPLLVFDNTGPIERLVDNFIREHSRLVSETKNNMYS